MRVRFQQPPLRRLVPDAQEWIHSTSYRSRESSVQRNRKLREAHRKLTPHGHQLATRYDMPFQQQINRLQSASIQHKHLVLLGVQQLSHGD
jgi:hypothetical protein